MAEQICTVDGDIEVCYETFGDPSDPAMLLMMGLATQMLGWHEDFCAELAERGFFVIRFDNRDVGRSQRMDGRGAVGDPAPAARQAGGQLHARRHGGGRASGCSTTSASTRAHVRRRLDGRHDRPDDGGAGTRTACCRWCR